MKRITIHDVYDRMHSGKPIRWMWMGPEPEVVEDALHASNYATTQRYNPRLRKKLRAIAAATIPPPSHHWH